MNYIKHSKKFRIKQPIGILFPLFSAEGEKLWVPGWDYKNVMGLTDLHEDYVFITTAHDHASEDAIWLVKRYDPESYFVQFYKIEPETKIGVITVQCFELEKNLTEVKVDYEYRAISDKGKPFILSFDAVRYEAFINEWERLLNTYFESKS